MEVKHIILACVGLFVLFASVFIISLFFMNKQSAVNLESNERVQKSDFVREFQEVYLLENSTNEFGEVMQFIVGNDGIAIAQGDAELYIELPQVVNYQYEADRVRIYHGQYEGLFYMLDAERLEWEIYVPRTPNINCYGFPINLTNMTLFYQPPVNEVFNPPQAYGFDGCNATDCWNNSDPSLFVHREENKIYSFAMYDLEGNKMGDLDRPFVNSNQGFNWLYWNNSQDQLLLCGFDDMPGNARNLVIGPTVGQTTIGGGTTGQPGAKVNRALARSGELTCGDTITDICLYGRINPASNIDLGVYNVSLSTGIPNILFFNTTNTSATACTSGPCERWYCNDVSWEISDTYNYTYGFAVDGTWVVRWDSETDGTQYNTGYTVLPQTWTSGSNFPLRYTQYFNYTEGTCGGGGDCWSKVGQELYVPSGCDYYQDGEDYI